MFGWTKRTFFPFVPFYLPTALCSSENGRVIHGSWLFAIFCLSICFAITVFARFLEFPFWETGANMVGDEFLLATHDAYHWIAGADGFEFGAGHPMSEFARIVAELFGSTPAKVGFWLPVVMGGIFAASVCAWGVAYNAPLSGMCAGVLASLSPTFLARTLLGFYDTDLVILTFAVILGLVPAVWLSPWLITPYEKIQQWLAYRKKQAELQKTKPAYLPSAAPVTQVAIPFAKTLLVVVSRTIQLSLPDALLSAKTIHPNVAQSYAVASAVLHPFALASLIVAGGFGYWMQDWHSLFPYLVRFSALIIPILVFTLGPVGFRWLFLHGAVCHVFPLLLGWAGVAVALIYAACAQVLILARLRKAQSLIEVSNVLQGRGKQSKVLWRIYQWCDVLLRKSRASNIGNSIEKYMYKPVWLLCVWGVVVVLCVDATVIQNMLASFSSYAVRSGDISSVGTALNDPLVFPSVAQSIIEVQEITLSDVLNYIYPSELIVNLAILSFGIAIVFIPSLVWFIPLAALSLLSVRMGGRMTMFGSPVLLLSLCLMAGYLLEQLLVFAIAAIGSLKKKISLQQLFSLAGCGSCTVLGAMRPLYKSIKLCCAFYFTFTLAWPLVGLMPEYIQGPIISKHQAQALQYIKNNTPTNSVVWNWWDWGYATHHFAQRTTIADGARHGGPSLYLPAAVYTTADPRFARQLIKYTASKNNQPGGVFAGLSATEAQKLMVALSDKKAPLIEANGDQYLVVSSELLRVGFWVTKYGSWNFIKKVAPGALMNIISTPLKYKLDTGMVRTESTEPVPASTIDVLGPTALLHKEYPYKGAYHFIFAGETADQEHTQADVQNNWFTRFWVKQRGSFSHVLQPKDKMVVDDVFYNTLMVQLLLSQPNDPKITPYFTLVYDNVYTRVYKVK